MKYAHGPFDAAGLCARCGQDGSSSLTLDPSCPAKPWPEPTTIGVRMAAHGFTVQHTDLLRTCTAYVRHTGGATEEIATYVDRHSRVESLGMVAPVRLMQACVVRRYENGREVQLPGETHTLQSLLDALDTASIYPLLTDRLYPHIITAKLAKAFSAKLRETIGAENLARVVKLNAGRSHPDVCHSHDFCDANMVMFDAYTALLGGEPFMGEATDSPKAHQSIDLFNAAWSLAKAKGFYVAVTIADAQVQDDMDGTKEVQVILSDDRHVYVTVRGDSLTISDAAGGVLSRIPLSSIRPEGRP